MKHVFKLTKEELAMRAAVKRSDLRPITPEEQERIKAIARNTTAKTKSSQCASQSAI